MSNRFVIGLGGSVAFPEEINASYLKRFYNFIIREIKRGNKFIIVLGGGYTARKYQDALAKVAKLTDWDKDWIGIHSTRLNAHFMRTVFSKEANPVVFDKRFKIRNFNKYSVLVASGWHPGWSTDYVSVRIATDFKIKQVIILGKPDFVYTSDFEKDGKAKPIYRIDWKGYLKLIPNKWIPGMHSPIDPVAARLAQKEKIKVVVAKGTDFNNIRKILRKEKFKGTILD